MVDFDPAIINKVFESTDPVPVTREQIAKFCETISEQNPIFTDDAAAKQGPYGGIIAPPGFATTFRNGRHFFQHIPRFGKAGFDAGKDVEFVAPIRPGDSIRTSSRIKEVYEKTGRSGAMLFIVISSELRRADGQIVARVDHRFTTPLERRESKA